MADDRPLSGQILNVPGADPSVVTLGDPQLAEVRAKLFRSWAKDSSNIRRPLLSASESIQDLMTSAPLKDGKVATKLLKKLDASIAKEMVGAFDQIEGTIRDGVDKAISRSSRAQVARLKAMGIKPPTSGQLKAARNKVLLELDRPFPDGQPLTFMNRLGRMEQKQVARVRSLVRGKVEDALGQVDQALTRALEGRTPTPGGSVYKQSRRILVAEETRLSNRIDLEVLDAAGVMFAHWRLNPAHRWYGGKEVCEYNASRVHQPTADLLAQIGVDAVDPGGLYSLKMWPEYPHPFCKCFPEAWFPPELRAALDDVATVANKVAGFPDEVIGASALSGVEANAATATLQAISSEANVGANIALKHVEALGPEGSAKALAQRVRQLGKRDEVLGAVRAKLANDLPAIEAQLDITVTKLQKQIAAISNDRLLAERTKASLKARIQAELQREVVQNSSNLRTLLTLEQELALKAPTNIRSLAFNSQGKLVRKMADLNLRKGQYIVNVHKGNYWAEITDTRISSQVVKDLTVTSPAKRKRILDIKAMKKKFSMKNSRTILDEFAPGHKFRRFNLDPGQQAGALLIEEEGAALLHFAPGLGKTPMATASINDLAVKGKIKRALVSPPAGVREQFTREIMKFSDDSVQATLFVPQSDIKKTLVSLRESIEADLKDNDSLSAKAIQKIVDNRMKRISVQGVPRGPTAVAEFEAIMAKDQGRFLVMGHDDMAAFAQQLPRHVDYAAIDEVHQLTSAVAGQGSAKSEALQKLTGGRIKYKVGLTGTAVRNNVGELWDTANWLRPGVLPNKTEFMNVYSSLTLESNLLQNSTVKALRGRIDDFTFSLPSPVKAELKNFMNDPGDKLRRLQLSSVQTARAKRIEKEFQRIKDTQKALSREAKQLAEKKLKIDRKDLERVLKKYGITDPNSPKMVKLSVLDQNKVKVLRSDIGKNNKLLHPETWRDNEHFLNIHNRDGKTNAKVQELKKLLQGPLKGDKTIVHLERTSSIETIQAELEGLRVATYTGDMSMSARSKILKEFNNGEYDVILVTRAGSTGLNLQKASASTIHFDTPFTQAEYLQREARNWRRGQERGVRSYLLHNDDSFLDRRRLEILNRKKKVLDAVDEARKIEDVEDYRLLVKSLSRKDMKSYEKLIEANGRKAANDLLVDMCRQLALPPDEPCPFDPIHLADKVRRKQPVLQSATAAQRKKIVE